MSQTFKCLGIPCANNDFPLTNYNAEAADACDIGPADFTLPITECIYADQPLNQVFCAPGFIGPWTWAITGGLPGGLSTEFNFPGASQMLLTGTPDTPGIYHFSIVATDGGGNVFAKAMTVQILPTPESFSDSICGFVFIFNGGVPPTHNINPYTMYYICPDGSVQTINVPANATVLEVVLLFEAAIAACFPGQPPFHPPHRPNGPQPPGPGPGGGHGGGGVVILPGGEPTRVSLYGNYAQTAFWSCPAFMTVAAWTAKYNYIILVLTSQDPTVAIWGIGNPPPGVTNEFLTIAFDALTVAAKGSYTVGAGTFFASKQVLADNAAARQASLMATNAQVCFSCLTDGFTGLCVDGSPLTAITQELDILITGKPGINLANTPAQNAYAIANPNLGIPIYMDLYEIVNIDGSTETVTVFVGQRTVTHSLPPGLTAIGLGPSNAQVISLQGSPSTTGFYKFTAKVTLGTPGPYYGNVYTQDYVIETRVSGVFYWSFDTELSGPDSWANLANSAYPILNGDGLIPGWSPTAGILSNAITAAQTPGFDAQYMAQLKLDDADPNIQALVAGAFGFTIRFWMILPDLPMNTYELDLLVFRYFVSFLYQPVGGQPRLKIVINDQQTGALIYVNSNLGLLSPPLAWHRIIVTFDFVAQQVGIQIDNGAVVLGAVGTPDTPETIGGPVTPGKGEIRVYGKVDDGATSPIEFDEYGIWNYIWDSTQALHDWNNGSGRTWPAP